MNPDLDLAIERVIHAPRQDVWEAWTDPASLEQWWIPAPTLCRVESLDLQPGGAFATMMSEDGETFVPHLNACFLLVEPLERIVFTNVLDGEWRPTNPHPVAMTAEIVMRDHPDGTDYRVTVRHGDPAHRAQHAALGFADGWGTVTDQLARHVEEAANR